MMIQNRPTTYAEKLRDIVQDRECLVFTPKNIVPDIVKQMHEHGVGAGGVLDNKGRFIGLVTEREIVRKSFEKTLSSEY